jgi:hypothetical protein
VQAIAVHLNVTHLCPFIEQLAHVADRDQATARENVLANKISIPQIGSVARIRNRNGLDKQLSARAQATVQNLKIGGQIGVPNGFDHFNGNDLVIGALNIPIVLKQQGDTLFKAQRTHAVPGIFKLCFRQGGGGDTAAVVLCCKAGQPAPAGANFQQVIPGAEFKALANAVQFVDLGRLQTALPDIWIDAGGVLHQGVKELLVHVVAEVIVRGNVGPTARPVVAHSPVLETHQRPCQPAGGIRQLVKTGIVTGCQLHQGRKIGRTPFTPDKTLGRPNTALPEQAPVDAGIQYLHARLQRGVCVSEKPLLATFCQGQARAFYPGKGTQADRS